MVRIKYAKQDIRRMMTDFMQPLTLSEKFIGKFFNNDVQEYTLFIRRTIFLILLCNFLVIHEDSDDVITNHRFEVTIVSDHILIELSN